MMASKVPLESHERNVILIIHNGEFSLSKWNMLHGAHRDPHQTRGQARRSTFSNQQRNSDEKNSDIQKRHVAPKE